MEIDIDLHPKQGLALLTEANEILYGGAAGGGKSHLMRCIAILICMFVPGVQVYLFRKNFGDLYKNHMEGPTSFIAMLTPLILKKMVKVNAGDHYIRFWNGSMIHLCHLQHTKDLLKYQGPEIHVLLMDELTHFIEKEYRFLRNRVRLGGLVVPDIDIIPGFNAKLKLPLILAGSNPGSIGHTWVKRTFVDYCNPHEVLRTPKKDGGMKRTYIPARLDDNPTLLENDPGYEDRLEGLGDPALVKAMKDGDWNIVAGGALDDVWSDRNIIRRFRIPKEWRIDRSFDWGSSHPFSVGWWAESNGEEVEYIVHEMNEDGKLVEYKEYRAFPRGSLIRIHEWYGSKELGTNEGVKMSPTGIAEGIVEIEKHLREQGWISTKVRSGPADGQIYQEIRKDIDTIADRMSKSGVRWVKADKSPGSRINGLVLLRERMKETEGPGIYFMQHCKAAISLLPVLPRDEKNTEDVDTKAEDHLYDEVRYRVLAGGRKPAQIKARYAR